ncbi:MAG: DUF2828 family protein [Clostridia bacterium]|nr:DUF2828 family protein [Clostridia bacterium]
MNTLLNGMKNATNYTYTENGALTHKSTMSGLLDLFGMGAAYRTRSNEDCIVLFEDAFKEDKAYALKCLFYLRDIRGGQGERRFFRVVTKYLANKHTDAMSRNLRYVPEFGRWDDLYVFVGTKLEKQAFDLMKAQLMLDVECKTPSLLAKWLKSENTSSTESRALANKTRAAFGMNHRQYRKTLSVLRERINVLERLMSAGKWDEIEFDKIPSKAGFQYRNAFARHDIERMKSEKQVRTYEDFMKDDSTKVNAKDLYPYEVVAKAYNLTHSGYSYWNSRQDYDFEDSTERRAINKYWDNLTDYFNGCTLDALCMIDTSGSMWGSEASAPINVAISIGLYAAERARGPFAGHYISFSSQPQLIETKGVDFCDKVQRIYKTNLCENTNIEAAFDMILDTALRTRCKQSDLPGTIIVVSDMEFDSQRGYYGRSTNTLMENIEAKWRQYGYKMPNLVYWNVQARQNNIPMTIKDGVTYVSGFSPVLFEQIMKGKTAWDLVKDKLDSERYACIK